MVYINSDDESYIWGKHIRAKKERETDRQKEGTGETAHRPAGKGGDEGPRRSIPLACSPLHSRVSNFPIVIL